MKVLPKFKILWDNNTPSGYISKRIESSVSKMHLYTHVHNKTIHNLIVEATQCSRMRCSIDMSSGSTSCDIYKQWNILLKRKKILTHGTIWMNLVDIMLHKISQSLNASIVWFHLTWGTHSSQTHRNRAAELWLPRVREKRMSLMGTEFQFGQMRKFWRLSEHYSTVQ